MLATTMGGQGTGLGGQVLVLDDPHDTEKIISEKERERALHKFDHKLYTRLDDRKTGVIVLVMQRLHTKDLSGHLLEGAGGERWEHLCIPMKAPARKVYIFPVSKKQHVREEGELLHPAREGPAEIEEHKERLGSLGYAGQFQQRPVPEGGAIFKSSYFRLWPEDTDRNIEPPRVIRTVHRGTARSRTMRPIHIRSAQFGSNSTIAFFCGMCGENVSSFPKCFTRCTSSRPSFPLTLSWSKTRRRANRRSRSCAVRDCR